MKLSDAIEKGLQTMKPNGGGITLNPHPVFSDLYRPGTGCALQIALAGIGQDPYGERPTRMAEGIWKDAIQVGRNFDMDPDIQRVLNWLRDQELAGRFLPREDA